MYTLLTTTTPGSQYGLEVKHRAQLSASCITSNSWFSPTIIDWVSVSGLYSMACPVSLEVWMLYPEPQNAWVRSSSCFHLFYVCILPSCWTGSYPGRTTRRTQLGNVFPSLAFLCMLDQAIGPPGTYQIVLMNCTLHTQLFPPGPGSDLSCSGNRFLSAPWPWGCQNPSLRHQSLAIPHTF